MDWVLSEWFIVQESTKLKSKTKEIGITYQCIVKGCSHKVKTLDRLCHHLKKHFFKCPEDNGKFKCFCKLVRHIQKEHLIRHIPENQAQDVNSNKEEIKHEGVNKSENDQQKLSNITIPKNSNDEIPKKRQNLTDIDKGASKKFFHSDLKPFKHSESVYKDTWKSRTNDFSSSPSYGVPNLSTSNGSVVKEAFEKNHHEEVIQESPTEKPLIKPAIPHKKSINTKTPTHKDSNNSVKCISNPFAAKVAKKSAIKFEDKSANHSHIFPQKHQFCDNHAQKASK